MLEAYKFSIGSLVKLAGLCDEIGVVYDVVPQPAMYDIFTTATGAGVGHYVNERYHVHFPALKTMEQFAKIFQYIGYVWYQLEPIDDVEHAEWTKKNSARLTGWDYVPNDTYKGYSCAWNSNTQSETYEGTLSATTNYIVMCDKTIKLG